MKTRRGSAADPDAWLLELNPTRRAEPEGHRRYAGIGSRQTPAPVLEQMRSIGAAMAEAGWLLRSGAAQGADSAFEAGAANRTIAARQHPRWNVLGAGAQKLMVRNVHQILGDDPASPDPVDLVICWTPRGTGSGGTGMALRLANDHGIPVIDLGADRTHVHRALERASLPETAARLSADPVRQAPGSTYRVAVAGESRPDDRAAIEPTSASSPPGTRPSPSYRQENSPVTPPPSGRTPADTVSSTPPAAARPAPASPVPPGPHASSCPGPTSSSTAARTGTRTCRPSSTPPRWTASP